MIQIEPTIEDRFGRALRRRALASFLAQAAEAAKLEGEVSVLLTADAEIRRLNREYRHKDKATDVLSFPAPAGGHVEIAGDLAVSVETAARQADEAGHALFVELQVLVLHGVLHLAGYDHETDGGRMARKEASLRKRFGLEAGLIERTARMVARPAAAAKRGGARR